MTLDKSTLVTIRDFLPSDHNFILATWLRGLKYGNEFFNLIEPTAYFSTYHQVIENLINNPATTVKVASLKEDPDTILGYCVYSNDNLHWVFTKKAWRGIGIAKSLVPPTITRISHFTDVGKALMKTRPYLIFNPF